MKKALLLFVQFFLFLVTFLAGSLVAPFRFKWFVSHPTLTSTRFFVPDGLLMVVGLYLLILLLEISAKRLRGAGAMTSIAFVVALVLGLLGKFGWATHDLF